MRCRTGCAPLHGMRLLQRHMPVCSVFRNEHEESAAVSAKGKGRGGIQADVQLHAVRKMHHGMSKRHKHKTYHPDDQQDIQ